MAEQKGRVQCLSVRLSNVAREALFLLVGNNPPLQLPAWDSRAIAPRSMWMEIAFGSFLASTLRGKIANDQIDFCANATEQIRLWVSFVKAERGLDGYTFSGADVGTRRVIPPQTDKDDLWK